MSNSQADYKNIYEATKRFRDVRMDHWLHHDLFSLQWWLLLALTIVPWFIWWKLADKQRLLELMCYGTLIAAICIALDAIGTVNLWWMYRSELIIQFPGLLVADISDIPVVFMLVYQYCSTWKSFIIAMVFVSIAFAFVIEPLFMRVQLYNPLSWEYVYSFLVYMFMAMLIRLMVMKLKEQAVEPLQR
ncbi:CBO0543 family protein [Alicyclobacillus fastidiosus]|uniref:CBO0543 family protein n=1 Tax=Alicyclobacillus fastidiosus TaxID=392011 RepID=A0ABV5ALS5_9BACL|nr:CBO0543 family protein [Alicyclobacillus fastidiosus]WEH11081.1 hypothetical protein PYS47_07650 [Alicyclobacillus fastidiosus]